MSETAVDWTAAYTTGPIAYTDDEPVRWLDESEQRSWRAILRATRLLEAALDRDLRVVDIQLSEYEILSMLSESPSGRLRMSDLAAMVVQSRSRLTHTAKRLEARRWVARESCLEDKRGVELVLTTAGQEAVYEIAKVHVRSVRAHLVDVMSRQQFHAVGEGMAIVRDHLDPEGQSGH